MKWISVKEGLPGEEGKHGYLVYANERYYVAQSVGVSALDGKLFFAVDGEYEPMVTHYMPLPVPPKTEREGAVKNRVIYYATKPERDEQGHLGGWDVAFHAVLDLETMDRFLGFAVEMVKDDLFAPQLLKCCANCKHWEEDIEKPGPYCKKKKQYVFVDGEKSRCDEWEPGYGEKEDSGTVKGE